MTVAAGRRDKVLPSPRGCKEGPSQAQFYVHISGRALELTRTVREDFGFSGASWGQILIDIASAIDPLVRTIVQGHGML
jgi:hypothetical protein